MTRSLRFIFKNSSESFFKERVLIFLTININTKQIFVVISQYYSGILLPKRIVISQLRLALFHSKFIKIVIPHNFFTSN